MLDSELDELIHRLVYILFQSGLTSYPILDPELEELIQGEG